MTRHGRWGCVLVVASLPATLGAQSLDEILAKHLAARGGAEKLAALTSLRMTAKAKASGGREAILVRELKRPDRIRVEFMAQGVTGVYAYDGARGWRVSPFDGVLEPQPMPPESTQLAIEHSDLGGPLVDWKAKGSRLELAGAEPVDGRKAWKLKVTSKTGDERQVFLDAQSYLQVRTDAQREVRGQKLPTETRFGDYRATAGILFPHTIEVGVKNRPDRLKILVQTVEVNPPLDDARFRMPVAAR